MRHALRAGAELKHRQNLGARIDGQPQPEHLGGTAQSGAQFVQLQVREVEIAEAALMEDLSVPACASEPGGDRRLTIAEDAFSRGSVQPFGECRQHLGDLLGGGFQMVQRSIASSTERGVAGLTTERLDRLSTTMFAISDQRVDVSFGDPEVRAWSVGTSEAFGGYPLGGSPPAFDLAPGAHRRRSRSHNRRVGAREATGGAIVWGARLEQTVERAALSPSS